MFQKGIFITTIRLHPFKSVNLPHLCHDFKIYFMVHINVSTQAIDKILHCFMHNVACKKTCIEFFHFVFFLMIYNTFRENSIGTAKPFLGSNLFYYIVIKRKVVHNLSNYNNAQLTIGFAYLSSTSSLSFNPLKREKTNFCYFLFISFQ